MKLELTLQADWSGVNTVLRADHFDAIPLPTCPGCNLLALQRACLCFVHLHWFLLGHQAAVHRIRPVSRWSDFYTHNWGIGNWTSRMATRAWGSTYKLHP